MLARPWIRPSRDSRRLEEVGPTRPASVRWRGLLKEKARAGSRAGNFALAVLVALQLAGCGADEAPGEVPSAAQARQALSFQDSAGLVSMEAENFTATTSQGAHNWALTTAAGASGASVMVASPNNGASVDTGYVAGSPRLDYQITFAQSGSYRVWVRGRDTGATAGSNDSVHVGLDGAAVATADRISTFSTTLGWTQATMDGPVATLQVPSAGTHTVNVWMREDGFAIDKLVLTRDTAFVPTGAGPSETPVSGGPGTCSPATYEAENITQSTGGSVTGGWNIWSNGNISTAHTFTAGATTLTVRAQGTQALNVWPHMLVSVGGQTIGQVNVTTTGWADYTFPFQASAGSQTITVAFDNDYYDQTAGDDRNLLVDRLAISCAATSCVDGQTQSGSTACGLNGRGRYTQLCTAGTWQNTSTCTDTDICLDASTRAGTTSCGPNGRGLLNESCVSGQWQPSAVCVDVDECTDGAVRAGSTTCGSNRFLQQSCQEGTWTDTTSCVAGSLCGDGVCGGAESCSSCAIDCAACSFPSSVYYELELGGLSGAPGFSVVANSAASAGAYLTPSSDNTAAPGPNRVELPFNVAAGTYTLWLRANAASAADDSIWFKVDGGAFIRWNDFPTTGWRWDAARNSDVGTARINFTLTAGSHLLTIANREDGFLLDKVYLTRNGDTPTGLGSSAGVCGDALCSAGEACDSCASDCGSCVVCAEGATQPGAASCGLNGRGVVEQLCVGGQWTNTTACADADICVDSATRPGTTTCGPNNRGILDELCSLGQWQDSTTCVDVDECFDSSTQPGSTACGQNGRGAMEQTCVTGGWQDTALCLDPDVCVDGSDRPTSAACGLNGRGTSHELCVVGAWAASSSCDDPDVCVDGGSQSGSTACGLNNRGTLLQACQVGTWADTSTCADVDTCLDGDTRADSPCGLNNRGLSDDVCLSGSWQAQGCTDGDVCVDGATQPGTTPCGTAGSLSQQCTVGQWADGSTCVEPGRCGDDVCSETENCGSCALDCGVCGLPTGVYLEAELGSFSGTPTFQVATNTAAAGGAYITPTSNNTAAAGPNRAEYQFSVEAGLYTVWLRASAASVDDDSVWVSMDGGAFVRWNDFPQGGWVWSDARNSDSGGAALRFNLTAGAHVLTIANRENGFLLDKFYITKDGDTPSGLGLPNDFCGDAVCGPTEDCSICESDCGTCIDSDNDGVPDPKDQCTSTAPGTAVDERGCDANDPQRDGEFLFSQEQFGGNGRTCSTCHGAQSGTISPAEVQALFASDPTDPLFRSIDSDDGASNDYTELLARATFRVDISLPPNVSLTADPTATSVVLRRSVPTTINTPALDPTLMWDGRAPSLFDQAIGAILGHAEASVTPTLAQLQAIAQFEKTDAFFSADFLREFARGAGPTPDWPLGVTAEEQRGRRWFAPDPQNAPRFNICGQCHGGPMTNETQANSGLPVGQHFQTVNVSEFNTRGNPTFSFTFPNPPNPAQPVTVVTPDPGLALTTGRVADLNFFKIPTLWGVKKTAPYFHDNSANTLEELVDHYEDHLATFLPVNAAFPIPHVPTAQDKLDIIAYLNLL